MSTANDIAVILIHGIGDLEPGDVLQSASQGIQNSFPDISLPSSDGVQKGQKRKEKGKAYVDSMDLEWQSRRLRLVEFYWAQIPGKIRALHPIRALGQVLGTLKEVPSMSVGASTSPGIARLAAFCGYLQQALVVLALILSLIAIGNGFRKAPDTDLLDVFATFSTAADRDTQGKATPADTEKIVNALARLWTDYPALVVLGFLAPFVASAWLMLLVGCFAFPLVGSVVTPRWRQLGLLWRTVTASAFLMVLAIWIIAFLTQGILMEVNAIAGSHLAQNVRLGEEPLVAIILVLMFLATGKAGLITANLLRDVVHYLATDNHGHPLATQQTIQEGLWKITQELRQDPRIGKIVLVAHSLGTVILIDLLRSRAQVSPGNPGAHLDIVTAGSPLLRLIHRFLPDRLPAPATIYKELTRSTAIKIDRWFNVYRMLDYVGQAITRRADPPGGIVDRPLLPRFRLPLGHANYWGDPRFVDFIAKEVIATIRDGRNNANRPEESTNGE